MAEFFTARTKSKRGFIGPIGDDLPSLVPIVVALLLFFSVFGFTLNSFNAKNDLIKKQTDFTSVARSLKGDSLILSPGQYTNRCNEIKLKLLPYNFMAAIYPADESVNNAIEDFRKIGDNAKANDLGNNDDLLSAFTPGSDVSILAEKDPASGAMSAYFCAYMKVGATDFTTSKKSYAIRFYPVAVQHSMLLNDGEMHYLVVPSMMAVLFWE